MDAMVRKSSRFSLRREAELNSLTTNEKLRGEHYANRDDTPLETAVDTTWEDAQPFLDKLPSAEREALIYSPDILQKAAFCGHLMADLDSIAGAIGAALLYGGTPARASEINSETRFALDYWGIDCPIPIEEIVESNPQRKICLVDFQQQSQMNSIINMDNIVGVIDHHAIQGNAIVTGKPIYIDIRPWGSMCTILSHCFAVQEKHLPKPVAGLLLSAILSDTLNLRSPTTSKWDERMVSMLVQYIDPEFDVNMYAASQFRAKSRELNNMTPYQLVNGDTKTFKFNDAQNETIIYTVSYGVIETTDAASSLSRVDELIPEMRASKEEGNLTAIFLAVVDIVNMTSVLIICGKAEASLGVTAYGGTVNTDGKTLALTGLVSRKKDFIPPLTRAFKEGWKPPREKAPLQRRMSQIVMDYDGYAPGRLRRVFYDNQDQEQEGK